MIAAAVSARCIPSAALLLHDLLRQFSKAPVACVPVRERRAVAGVLAHQFAPAYSAASSFQYRVEDHFHAVIGGFHLAPYKEDYVRQTIAALEGMDIDYVIPLHCSGEVFYEFAKSEMPTRLLRSYTGTRFVFEGSGA